ncbi:MAG: glycine cleavage system protein H [Holophagae bacterium]|nr:glycine cleavage system protein H [Holophagae bacterium]
MTSLLVAFTFLGCFLMVRGTGHHGTSRKLDGFPGDVPDVEGLKEVFPNLPPERRVCRYYFGNQSGAPVYCENEYDCVSCHIHRKMMTSGLGQMEELNCKMEVAGMPFQLDRYYHRGHVWARPERNGFVRIGLDSLALRMIGQKAVAHVPDIGEMLEEGECSFSVTRPEGKTLPFLAPMSGEVMAVNPDLKENLADSDKSENTWVMVIKPFSLSRELQNLLYGAEAAKWFRYEMDSLVRMAAGKPGEAEEYEFAADGGALDVESLMDFPWDKFITNFLLSA